MGEATVFRRNRLPENNPFPHFCLKVPRFFSGAAQCPRHPPGSDQPCHSTGRAPDPLIILNESFHAATRAQTPGQVVLGQSPQLLISIIIEGGVSPGSGYFIQSCLEKVLGSGLVPLGSYRL